MKAQASSAEARKAANCLSSIVFLDKWNFVARYSSGEVTSWARSAKDQRTAQGGRDEQVGNEHFRARSIVVFLSAAAIRFLVAGGVRAKQAGHEASGFRLNRPRRRPDT
jgi:hypothetical protein